MQFKVSVVIYHTMWLNALYPNFRNSTPISSSETSTMFDQCLSPHLLQVPNIRQISIFWAFHVSFFVAFEQLSSGPFQWESGHGTTFRACPKHRSHRSRFINLLDLRGLTIATDVETHEAQQKLMARRFLWDGWD